MAYPDIATRAEQYRARAGQCDRQALQADNTRGKENHYFLAKTWRRLADMIEERAALIQRYESR
jgi:hypothetical protein